MARSFKITKKEFIEVYHRIQKTREISFELNITMPTVYAYLKKFKLSPKTVKAQSEEFIKKLFNEYKGLISVDDLAVKYKILPGIVRYNLEKRIYQLWELSKKKPFLPKPTSTQLIRIYNELIINPELINNSKQLASITNIPRVSIERYLLKSKKIKKKKRSRSNVK